MSITETDIDWRALPTSSRRRVDWDRLYEPMLGLFHAGAKEVAAAKEACTPERLGGLRDRASRALQAAESVFSSEADRLKRERQIILGVAVALTLVLIVLVSLTSSRGYELVNSVLAAGGTGGLLAWSITSAFKRVDQETQLRLFPRIFALQFGLCSDCEQYEGVFQKFVSAAEKMRG